MSDLQGQAFEPDMLVLRSSQVRLESLTYRAFQPRLNNYDAGKAKGAETSQILLVCSRGDRQMEPCIFWKGRRLQRVERSCTVDSQDLEG